MTTPPGRQSPNGDFISALQGSRNYQLYIFRSGFDALEYMHNHPGKWVAPHRAHGRRRYPDRVIDLWLESTPEEQP